MKNADKPAHPRPGYELSNLADNEHYYHEDGLTKRELIAAMAMQGMLSASADRGEAYVAERSIAFADYLLKQLE